MVNIYPGLTLVVETGHEDVPGDQFGKSAYCSPGSSSCPDNLNNRRESRVNVYRCCIAIYRPERLPRLKSKATFGEPFSEKRYRSFNTDPPRPK